MLWLAVLFAAIGLVQVGCIVVLTLRRKADRQRGETRAQRTGYRYFVALEFVLAGLCFAAAFVLIAG
jgi:uncharacterized membrane protein (DUF4010 family)